MHNGDKYEYKGEQESVKIMSWKGRDGKSTCDMRTERSMEDVAKMRMKG